MRTVVQNNPEITLERHCQSFTLIDPYTCPLERLCLDLSLRRVLALPILGPAALWHALFPWPSPHGRGRRESWQEKRISPFRPLLVQAPAVAFGSLTLSWV